MEKSSEKLIRNTPQLNNPFNNLLSEVHLRLPKPKPSKKPENNHVLDIDPNIDRSSGGYEHDSQFVADETPRFIQSQKENKGEPLAITIKAPLKTKNSSDTVNHEKNQKQLINQWIQGYIMRRHLLGTHWQVNLKIKNEKLMFQAFQAIKDVGTVDKQLYIQRNIQSLSRIVNQSEKKLLRQCFQIIKDDYKDQLFFRLSNTMGEEKQQSFMLKLDSDYGSQVKHFQKLKKQEYADKTVSVASHSDDRLITKKTSEVGSLNEDLSGLILNHNKLHLSGDLNRSVPNIPKSKPSIKGIQTNKQIGELSLQTKKKIITVKKLYDTPVQKQNDNLPLQSNKNLVKQKKQHDSILDKAQKGREQQPLTLTFLMKNINLTEMIKNRQESKLKQQLNNNNLMHLNKQNSNLNIINRLPVSQSFYHPINPPPIRNVFINQQQPQKYQQRRATSLQTRPLTGLFHIIDKPDIINPSQKHINFNNQYFPQDGCARENVHMMKETLIPIDKRARSATPRITFTFTSNGSQQSPKIHTFDKPAVIKLNHPNTNLFYEQKDFIVQKSLLQPSPQIPSSSIGLKETQYFMENACNRKNKLQVITPTQNNRISPRRATRKPIQNERDHIKNKILPPAGFNDYYGQNYINNSNTTQLPTISSPRSPGSPILNVYFKSNEIIYKDVFQNSTAQQSQQGNNSFRPERHLPRMKSPKDKILVTSASRGKIQRDN